MDEPREIPWATKYQIDSLPLPNHTPQHATVLRFFSEAGLVGEFGISPEIVISLMNNMLKIVEENPDFFKRT